MLAGAGRAGQASGQASDANLEIFSEGGILDHLGPAPGVAMLENAKNRQRILKHRWHQALSRRSHENPGD
jgi:hypothetical protein